MWTPSGLCCIHPYHRRNIQRLFFLSCVYTFPRFAKCIWQNNWPIKWNESGFRPPLCTYRLNWARRTTWGWWDDWDDAVLQTQDSKFEPWRSEAEHATSRSRRLPTILTFTRGWGRNIFVSFKPPRPGTEPRTLAWKAAVLTTTLGPPPNWPIKIYLMSSWFQLIAEWWLVGCNRQLWCCLLQKPVKMFSGCSAHARRWTKVELISVHRLRRWPNINPTLGQRFEFVGFKIRDILTMPKDWSRPGSSSHVMW